jgi:hypothetical protein
MLEDHLYLAMSLEVQATFSSRRCRPKWIHSPCLEAWPSNIHVCLLALWTHIGSSAHQLFPGYQVLPTPPQFPANYFGRWLVFPHQSSPPYTKGLLCYCWLSFRSHESSLHRAFIWFYFVIVCFCFFFGLCLLVFSFALHFWWMFSNFYLQGFSSLH